MSLALAALVVVLGQTGGGKVEVIKGKKRSAAQKQVKVVDAPELAPQPIIDKSKPPTDAKPNANAASASAGGANANDQADQTANGAAGADSPRNQAKADQQKAQQKQLVKISTDNQKLWQQSADALAGDTNP